MGQFRRHPLGLFLSADKGARQWHHGVGLWNSGDHPPDADRFYRSENWNEPPMSIDLDAVVPAGGGVWWDCSYQWREPAAGCDIVNERDHDQEGNCCYTFGNSAENAEHCNAFVYYWPKVESSVICF